MFIDTFWSLLPPLIAIALALITKEVYSSLFIGIVVGGLLYTGFSPEGTIQHVFVDGMIAHPLKIDIHREQSRSLSGFLHVRIGSHQQPQILRDTFVDQIDLFLIV